jgi:endonuclease YncB( thermonuclease family)
MPTRSLWCTRDAKNESDSTASTRLQASQLFTNPAKLFDSELCCRNEVRVEVKRLDRYQRTIADVIFARRRILNYEIVKAGLWFKRYAPNESTLEGLE